MSVFIQQAVIHAPRVDAEAVEIAEIFVFERDQSLLHLVVQIRQIPVKHAVHFDVIVFKAVQLAHFDFVAVKASENRAAVAGAQIEREQIQNLFHFIPLISQRLDSTSFSNCLTCVSQSMPTGTPFVMQ